MTIFNTLNIKIFSLNLTLFRTLTLTFLYLFSTTILAGDSLVQAVKEGKFEFSFRPRYEHVSDESKIPGNRDAEAWTARTTLGYKTGDFYRVFGYFELENVVDLNGDNEFNDGTNGLTMLPTIADPNDTEINQAYLGIKPFDKTLIKVGRQIITPRKAPFHRYLGTVLWRQNWQTHDAIVLENTYLPDTRLIAGYIWSNNTILGTERSMQAPIFNIKYDGFKYADIEAYYYDLDFTDRRDFANSNQTYGLRISGGIPVIEKLKFIYAGEFATQDDTGSNPVSYDANYYLVEGGFNFTMDTFINSVTAKISHEVLESDDGNFAFRTPLATGHAFQGWADNFLTTPAAGIEDTYFTTVLTGIYDTKLIVSYHMFDAETGSFDYGDEFDIWFTKQFMKHFTVGIKYAGYSASNDFGNTKATDLEKFWTYIAIKY